MPDRVWRVVIWAAVSSKRQAAEDKVSLEDQERQGRAFGEGIEGARHRHVLGTPSS